MTIRYPMTDDDWWLMTDDWWLGGLTNWLIANNYGMPLLRMEMYDDN